MQVGVAEMAGDAKGRYCFALTGQEVYPLSRGFGR